MHVCNWGNAGPSSITLLTYFEDTPPDTSKPNFAERSRAGGISRVPYTVRVRLPLHFVNGKVVSWKLNLYSDHLFHQETCSEALRSIHRNNAVLPISVKAHSTTNPPRLVPTRYCWLKKGARKKHETHLQGLSSSELMSRHHHDHHDHHHHHHDYRTREYEPEDDLRYQRDMEYSYQPPPFQSVPQMPGPIGPIPSVPPYAYQIGPVPRKKSLLIGINYIGSQHRLQGCHQDVENMRGFLSAVGYPSDPRSQVVMRDDPYTDPRGPMFPVAHNMLAAMSWLVSEPVRGIRRSNCDSAS